jgi:hypothetical protein
MSNKAKTSSENREFIPGTLESNRNSNIYISEPATLSYPGQKDTKQYITVFYPNSRETKVYEVEYEFDFQTQTLVRKPLDPTKVLAEYNTNTQKWIPKTRAGAISSSLSQAIANQNSQLFKNFTTNHNNTISTVYRQQNGSQPTAQQIQQIKNGGILPPTLAAAAGTPPQAGAGAGGNQGLSDTDINEAADAFSDALSTLSSLNPEATKVQFNESKLSRGLRYPEKWPQGTDAIKFESLTYGTKTFSQSNKDIAFSKRENTSTGESVYLPIQSGITDTNTVGWNEETINPAQIMGANLAVNAMTQGANGAISSLKNAIQKIQGTSSDVEKAVVASLVQSAVGAQILPKLNGSIINPNVELLFQAPQLRAFGFAFKLTPRSDTESAIVKRIIGFFKRNMAVKTTGSQIFLKAPNVFRLTYLHNEKEDHSGINLIKDCALQSCTVDYTPEGSYMSYADGGMVSYTLNLQFMELEPIYESDYNDDRAKDHFIGY